MNTNPRPRVLSTGIAVAALALSLSACSGEGEDDRAVDTGSSPSASGTPADPAEPPLPVGEERTEVGTVVDTGDGPELCLGAIEDSAPPQCSGIPLVGFDWADHPEHERQDDVRWGVFGVTGTYDGEAFTVSYAAPGAEDNMSGDG